MKRNKTALMVGIALIGAISFGWSSMDSKDSLSDLELANIEALTDGEGISPGDPCYNCGKYDINYPEVVKCGTPCKREKTDLPIFKTTSFCE